MKKLWLSAFSFMSLLYPHLVYGEDTGTPLWKIFCAHQVMNDTDGRFSENGRAVTLDPDQWAALVQDLDARTMPAGFSASDRNLDAWLRCENDFAERFESAEFLKKGLHHFSVTWVAHSAQDPLPVVNTVLETPQAIYQSRWKEFLRSLQKSVTLPKPGHTISMRSR